MKLLPLYAGRGKDRDVVDFCLVDEIDWEWARQWEWRLGSEGYAVRGEKLGGRSYSVALHREILSRKLGRPILQLETDHANRDRTDNTRDNLRAATVSQNRANSPRGNRMGQYRGVYKKSPKSWRAAISYHGTTIELGRFPSPELAAHAYDQRARTYYGEFAALNFPSE